MLTYKIIHAKSYDDCKNIGAKLTSSTTYCFAKNLFKFNCDIYGHRISQNHFNASVYYTYYSRCMVQDINLMYERSLARYKNVQSYHLIQVFDDGKFVNQVVITTFQQKWYKGIYTYAFTGVNSDAGWPSMIPEEYKKECTYVEYPEPYIPTEITDDNIVLRDNILYIDNKPLDNLGYYQNKDDVYKIDGDVCEVHLPFNIIHIKDIPEDIKKYKLKFINDNTKLEGHCKLCILNYDNKIQELNILNDDILINNGNDGKLFDEVIPFKQTI